MSKSSRRMAPISLKNTSSTIRLDRRPRKTVSMPAAKSINLLTELSRVITQPFLLMARPVQERPIRCKVQKTNSSELTNWMESYLRWRSSCFPKLRKLLTEPSRLGCRFCRSTTKKYTTYSTLPPWILGLSTPTLRAWGSDGQKASNLQSKIYLCMSVVRHSNWQNTSATAWRTESRQHTN